MTERPAGAVAENQSEDGDEDKDASLGRSRDRDPFAKAFKAAEKQLGDGDKPARKVKAVAKDDDGDEDGDDEPAPAKKKPQVKAEPQKKAKADDDDEDGDEADSEDDAPAKRRDGLAAKSDDKKPAVKKGAEDKSKDDKQPLKPKSWWSNERRSAFQFQPAHVQETWLQEAPTPREYWSAEQKDSFGKLPVEAREIVITQVQEMERGFNEKFKAIATERKMIEGIRASVSPQQRQMMQQRGIDEVGAFTALMRLQENSVRDPVGYARDFIMRNKIDPRVILGNAGDEGGENGQQAPAQADISSHPAMRALRAEIDAMKSAHADEARRRDEEKDRSIESELTGALAEKDTDGNSAYPYARVLASRIAQIFEADPDQFKSMGVRDRFAAAYKLALAEFPELQPLPKAAKPGRDDDLGDDGDREDEDEDEAKLKRAATKKSKRPIAATNGKVDPFDAAFRKAEKRLGQR